MKSISQSLLLLITLCLTLGSAAASPWTKDTGNPIIGPYAFTPWVIHDDGTYRMWYCSGSIVDEDIYYAESADGVQWTGQQVALALPGIEVGRACVLKEDGMYKMWYAVDGNAEYFTSSVDPSTFPVGVPVTGVSSWGISTIIRNESEYWSWECYNNVAYRSTSADGLSWTLDAAPALTGTPSSWDQDQIIPGCVVRDGSRWLLFYVGNAGWENHRIGLATSTDGLNWVKDPGNPIIGPGDPGTWDQHQVSLGAALAMGNQLKVWYTGNVASGGSQNAIGYASGYANQNGTVRLLSGSLNDAPVQDGVLELSVAPGQYIEGTVTVEADNYLDGSAVVPLSLIWNWGAHATAHAVIDGWISTGLSTHDVGVNLTAPDAPGTYYVCVAHTGEFTSGQVASLTNWAVGYDHWDDGHDVADWDATHYQETLVHGATLAPYEFVDGYHNWWIPAAMIKITVQSGPPLVCEPDPEGQGVRCRGTITRAMSPYVQDLAINVRTGDTLRLEPGAVLLLTGGWLVGRPGGTIISHQAQIVQQITGHGGPHCPCGINIEADASAEFHHTRVSIATPCGYGNAAILNCTGEGGGGGTLKIHQSTVISGGSTIVNCGTLDSVAVELLSVAPMENGTVRLMNGSLNGIAVTDHVLEVTVGAGLPVSGAVNVEADNWLDGSAVVPLVAVWGWGDHAASFQTIADWIPTGVSLHDVALDLTAPDSAGTYYITIAHSGEMSGGEVASLTNWSVGSPHWNDRLDIADWNSDKYDFTLASHAALAQYEFPGGYTPWWVPAAMIKLTVIDCDLFPPLPPEIVVQPNGIDAEIRWSPAETGNPVCPAQVDAYLVWYAPLAEGPFYFHGYTTDTSYVHHGVIRFAPSMFYEVQAHVGPLADLSSILEGTPREQALLILRQRD